jgi:hypothetical protein
MDQELQNKLFEKYPDLFSNKDKDIMTSCMAWGIECGNGWFDILSSLCWMIKQHEENKRGWKKYLQDNEPERLNEVTEYFPVKFDQIKEKFGGLRIYFSGGDEYVEGLIAMAESFSYKLCEVCGDRGSPNDGGWISTLCDNCRSKTNATR